MVFSRLLDEVVLESALAVLLHVLLFDRGDFFFKGASFAGEELVFFADPGNETGGHQPGELRLDSGEDRGQVVVDRLDQQAGDVVFASRNERDLANQEQHLGDPRSERGRSRHDVFDARELGANIGADLSFAGEVVVKLIV